MSQHPRECKASPSRLSNRDQMRVGIFNVKYSPNLGDGLLSECLESELVRNNPGLTIESFDLAGRGNYASGGRYREAALGFLQSSPAMVRQSLASIILRQTLRQIVPVWRKRLASIDVAVAGGGNLFSDADLNFPLKIDAACKLLRDAGIPVSVFAVGVSDNWSQKGEALFHRAFAGTRLLEASVRDTRSADVWNRRLGRCGVPSARVVHDPGLLVAAHVPQIRMERTTPRIGLGLTNPITLRYHADEQAIREADLTSWYVELVRGCLARGWQVNVFTNGSSEDDAYLARIRPALAAAAPSGDESQIAFSPRFRRPSELAAHISGLDLLMAHRLHANIAAYSYAVPHIGFTWDAKVKSFFGRVGREKYLCTAGLETPSTVLALAERCLQEGIDPARHARIVAEARADVATLATVLRTSCGRMSVPLGAPS